MRRHDFFPLVLFCIGTLLVVLLAVAHRSAELDRLQRETSLTGEQVKLRLEACLQTREALARSLAVRRWRDEEQVLGSWSQIAGALVGLYPGVQALNFIDGDWRIRVVVPEEPNAAALGKSLRENNNPSVIRALSHAEGAGELARTDIIDLLQGGKGFTLYQPLNAVDGTRLGYVNGVFLVDELIRTCIAERSLASRFRWAVYEMDDHQFYQSTGSGVAGDWPLQSELSLNVADHPWRFVFAPSVDYLQRVNSAEAMILAVVGLLFSALLAFVLRQLLIKQASLRESEDKYRLLVENQSDMVVQIDLSQNLSYVSPNFCRLMGRDREQMIGTPIWNYIFADDVPLVTAAWQQILNPPYRGYTEVRSSTAQGVRWIGWSSQAVLDGAGKAVSVTSVGRDMTDIRAMEERVAHSQKMQAIGELAGGITHDFNNLLQVIQGNVEFLKRNAPTEARGDYENIENVIQRAMALTAKLATLSRQESVHRRPMDLVPFLSEMEELLRRSLPAGISVTQSSPGHPVVVLADAGQIEQVVLNLCFNARDAVNDMGSLRIELGETVLEQAFCTLHPELEPGPHALLRVSDDGEGMSPELLQRIFDPFFTTKQEGDGTGLGLSNCDSIVRQHQGVILAESEPGRGSTFTVYLPLVEAQDTADKVAGPSLPEPGRTGRSLVLVVDDDTEVRRLISRILNLQGYEVMEAENGHDAVVTFSEHRQDIRLVVLDMVMPVMDGAEAASKIREIDPSVAVVFVSGYIPSSSEQLEGPLLRKPFKSSELINLVEAAFGD